MKIFVATLYRNGFRNAESFPLGAFRTKEKAESAAKRECFGRGYKYGFEISEFELDHYDDDEDRPLDEIVVAHGNPNWNAG